MAAMLRMWFVVWLVGGSVWAQVAPMRDTHSDTWAAVDGLGRRVPTGEEVGAPRTDRTVAMFYFLWLGRSGELGPYDITKILASDPGALGKPDSPLWGPPGYPHHWGESVFGYYRNDDPAVLRKHAQMLADAGVDTVIFDVTNQLTYPESWKALGRTFEEMRRAGSSVPRIAFLTPFWDPRKVVRELYQQLYEPGLYRELWFEWEGKPLILADPELLLDTILRREGTDAAVAVEAGQTIEAPFTASAPFVKAALCTPTWGEAHSAATLVLRQGDAHGRIIAQRRLEEVRDNAWSELKLDEAAPAGTYTLTLSEPKGRIGVWRNAKNEINLRVQGMNAETARMLNFFTFRAPQPSYFAGPQKNGSWSWLEVYPQHVFPGADGAPEQMSVGVAQNAVDGKLGVLSHPQSLGRSFAKGRIPDAGEVDFSGKNFAEQWSRVREVDPRVVFVTGWNEWIAGRYDQTFPLAGSGPVTFVDEFDREHSRDIEPMSGGHEDAYYYQLVAEVRRYKGARVVEAVKSRPIRIDGRFEDWEGVGPEFRDTLGDPVERDFAGWGTSLRYTDHSGRNDLAAARVSRSGGRLCFLLETRGPIVQEAGEAGPTLFIDSDANAATGWLGYDLAVGRTGGPVRVERNVGNRYEWAEDEVIEAAREGNRLELAVPLEALGAGATGKEVQFKWADHLAGSGEAADFTLHGDVAPNDRFNFRALFRAGASE